MPHQDVVVDCMALSLSTDAEAGRVTLEAIRSLRDGLSVKMTLAERNVSYGLPE